MTTEQAEAYQDQKESGKAETLVNKISAYLERSKKATTKMVATYIARPMSTATARLDELAATGKVI